MNEAPTLLEMFGDLWILYTLSHMIAYLFMSNNLFRQTYIYWVLQKTNNLSWTGHILFVIWNAPFMLLHIIFLAIYSIFTGKPMDIYSADKDKV